MTTEENAADASEFREECRRDKYAEAMARGRAMAARLRPQLAALPPDGGRVRDPETQYVYLAEAVRAEHTTSCYEQAVGNPAGDAFWVCPPHCPTFRPAGWLLRPVCRERYVDGDCPYPLYATGLCRLHYCRHRRQEAGTLQCTMDAPERRNEGNDGSITVRLPLELQLRCNVAAGRAGLANSTAQWVRGALEAACALSESMADPKRNPQFQPTALEK